MQKHYTINAYAKKTNATRAAVETMIDSGMLLTVKSGTGRVTYILIDENEEAAELRAEIENLKSMMSIMMNHFGIGGKNEAINFSTTRPIRRA